jgi:GNAT superfamily N-acetyltransferase
MMIHVRDALEADLPAMTAIKGEESEAIHRDRLHDAGGSFLRYLVLLADQKVIGFACLVFRRPPHWSDADDTQHLPQIVDLEVKESFRGRGCGTEFMHQIESITGGLGFKQLYLAVEPLDNLRAYAFYQRLGYKQLQQEPYHTTWAITDSTGKRHHGEIWVVDMVKQL